MGSLNEVIQRYIRAITRMMDWRCKTMTRVSGHYMLVWESLTVVGLQWTGPHCSLCTGLWGRVITKTLFRGPQCSATQRHSPGLLIIQAQLEWAYWIEERPWPQKDRPHKETTTKKTTQDTTMRKKTTQERRNNVNRNLKDSCYNIPMRENRRATFQRVNKWSLQVCKRGADWCW